MSDFWSDGFTDTGRNCGCGAGVFVLVDQFHGVCGVCGSTKLTQAGINKKFKDEHPEEYEALYSQFRNDE